MTDVKVRFCFVKAMKSQGKYYFFLFKAINGVPQYIVNSMLVGHEGLKLDNYQTDKRYLTVYCHLPCTIIAVLHDPGVSLHYCSLLNT